MKYLKDRQIYLLAILILPQLAVIVYQYTATDPDPRLPSAGDLVWFLVFLCLIIYGLQKRP